MPWRRGGHWLVGGPDRVAAKSRAPAVGLGDVRYHGLFSAHLKPQCIRRLPLDPQCEGNRAAARECRG